MLETNNKVVLHTQRWIESVVVGLNFCPFAAREIQKNSVRYSVSTGIGQQQWLDEFRLELEMLDSDASIETSFLIYEHQLSDFPDYLIWVEALNIMLENWEYEGIYQIASFHPDYTFEGSSPDDPGNFTNRSPYPMIHLLREESLEKAIASHPDIEAVPESNVKLARDRGLMFMEELLANAKK